MFQPSTVDYHIFCLSNEALAIHLPGGVGCYKAEISCEAGYRNDRMVETTTLQATHANQGVFLFLFLKSLQFSSLFLSHSENISCNANKPRNPFARNVSFIMEA